MIMQITQEEYQVLFPKVERPELTKSHPDNRISKKKREDEGAAGIQKTTEIRNSEPA